ncbi:MAG: hypothetical protein [Microvirus sp.]|nr:MAG: hypothetical protein [Microvirus sp.]
MKRTKMSRGASAKNFKQGTRVHNANKTHTPQRGGWRL